MEVCIVLLFGVLGLCAGYTAENVALRGEATQSSQFDALGQAQNAIDGDRTAVYQKKSCSRTHSETDPWWRVDLPRAYNITSVIITNREDCCSEMINGAQIRIGNSLDFNGNRNTLATMVWSIPAGRSINFTWNAMEGRYVNIFLPGDNRVLTLCEVEVYAAPDGAQDSSPGDTSKRPDAGFTPTHKTATSTFKRLPATAQSDSSKVEWSVGQVGGNCDVMLTMGSCCHALSHSAAWWRADLEKACNVTSVTITSQEDCCHQRIRGSEIRVGNSLENNGNANPLAARVLSNGESTSFRWNAIEGRYINVYNPGKIYHLSMEPHKGCYIKICNPEPIVSSSRTTKPFHKGANLVPLIFTHFLVMHLFS